MPDFISIKEIIEINGMYTGLTMGTSMWPLLRQQRDNIIVVAPKGRLKKYDIALYITDKGKYVMHRVIEVHDDHYVIMGDNLLVMEYVTDDMICGVLAGFYRKGKHYIDCENGRLYKLYSHIWVGLIPVRPVIVHIHNALGRIKRKVLKKSNGRAK